MMISKRAMTWMAVFVRVVLQVLLIAVGLSMLVVLSGRLGLPTVIHGGHTYTNANLIAPYHSDYSGFVGGLINDDWVLMGTVTLGVRVILISLQLVQLGLIACLLWLGVRFFSRIAQAEVFTRANARLLITAGYVGLVNVGLHELVLPWLTRWLLATFTPATLGGGMSFNPFLPLTAVFGVLIMGYVFAYGVSLQEETEGLV
ncbi:DUF2975 domain-containing protein [Lacticaseibacillus daqingensis]|uniref:DUF2975 domain-containing protein n=1 Tax=Lacticaseibacillus daqingensis TaxID=2486014 RepID=UPI0013DE5EBA|nr:DUF2975 domain-containing protein [Lacticaseibacillus daqingensis]